MDGGFSTKEDIESMGQRGVTVFAPVKELKKQEQQGKDPYAAKPGDSPEVAAWRERMPRAVHQSVAGFLSACPTTRRVPTMISAATLINRVRHVQGWPSPNGLCSRRAD